MENNAYNKNIFKKNFLKKIKIKEKLMSFLITSSMSLFAILFGILMFIFLIEESAKWWEKIVYPVISAIVGAIVGFFIINWFFVVLIIIILSIIIGKNVSIKIGK
jgi:uncharacterized membrane protein HdeD (DUF308 family)